MKNCLLIDTSMTIDFSKLDNVHVIDAKLNREKSLDLVSRDHDFLRKAIVTDNSRHWKKFFYNEVVDTSEFNTQDQVLKQINWIFSDFGRENKMNDKIFFTSDTHFFHRLIIKYCNRPWNHGKNSSGELVVDDSDVEEMNETMIRNWNSVVSKDSIVWHLGDFCLGSNQKETIPELVRRLNGKINLVLGNHDHHSIKFYYDAGFNKVYDRSVVISDFIILSHSPMTWVQSPFFNVFGHIHTNPIYNTFSKSGCCVCVERHNYTPISWKKIKEEYDKLVN